jgi:phenylalanyl-tRNA synthetase beta subunit
MFTPLPKFAEEQRDLAIVVDKTVTCGEIEDTMNEYEDYTSMSGNEFSGLLIERRVQSNIDEYLNDN